MQHLIFAQYDKRLQRRRRDKSTVSNYRRAVTYLEAWLAENGVRLEELTPEMLEEYFYELPLARSTKGVHLTNLRSAFLYALRRGVIERDPTLDVELERQPDPERRIVPAEALRRIVLGSLRARVVPGLRGRAASAD